MQALFRSHLSLNRVALAVDHCVRGDNAEGRGIAADHLELDRSHGAAHNEHVILVNGPIGLEEVRLEECLEQVAGQTLDGVVEGQHVDALAVLDVGTGLDGDDVGQVDAQVVADDAIHADTLIGHGLVGQDDADRLLLAFALQQHRVSAEQLQLVHFRLRQVHDGVVVAARVLHQQTVRAVLALQDGRGQVRTAAGEMGGEERSIRALRFIIRE